MISYDGAGFRGFAAQPGQRTVAGVLGEAIAVVVGHRVELVCAGRTDAGVHARGQVVHVDVGEDTDTVRLVRSVNTLLKPSVVIRSAEIAPPGFDARRSARARRYRYLVLEHDTPDPLLAPVSWHVPGPLDLRAMAAAADALLGEHDFRAFCRRAARDRGGDPDHRGGCSTPASARSRCDPVSSGPTPVCCGSTSRPPRSATRWSARWWGPWSRWAEDGVGRLT